MNKERLNELEKRKPDTNLGVFNQRIDGYSLTKNEFEELIAAARRCNELEAENAALKDVNWDISYPDGESLATIKAERDAMEKHADDVTQMLTMCQAERDALKVQRDAIRRAILPHCYGPDCPTDTERSCNEHGCWGVREMVQQLDTLRANNAALREAITPLLNDTARRRMEQEYIDAYRISEANPDDEHDRIYSGALAILLELERKCRVVYCATPADSLREYRNGISKWRNDAFDKAAEIVCRYFEDEDELARQIVLDIRAMKVSDDT